MKEQFVTYDIALALKELGFDWECICKYNTYNALKHCISGTNPDIDDHISYNKYDDRLLAPLYQEAIDWFRVKHNIWINIDTSSINFYVDDVLQPAKFQYYIEDLINRDIDDFILDHSGDDSLFYDNSSEARKAAILKAIELIKNRK